MALRSINVRGTIDLCTTFPRKMFYALVDGKPFVSGKGNIAFWTKGGLKSAMKQSNLYWNVIEPLADQYLEFQNREVSLQERYETRDKWWKKFLEPGGRVEIKEIDIC